MIFNIYKIYKWQSLIGSFIGAMTPFMLWWFTEKYRQRKKFVDNLYFLEKILVDQINDTIEMKKNITDFIDKKITELIKNINENDPNIFSIDYTFFPLFPVTQLSEQIYKINTQSGYIENRLAKSFQLSRNMPHIIKDLKRQFENTIELNRNLALNKINPPNIQKTSYLYNINSYAEMLRKDMLNTNIPVYLKSLVQAREALDELRKIGLRKWRIKFDPRYRFFMTQKMYLTAKENSYDKIEVYFKERVESRLKEIQKI